jgi:quercetin dioxygenase-like cupin family protein
MSRAGDMTENPITGELALVRVGTEETNGELLIVDVLVRPGGAVTGEHVHSVIDERFTVLHGRIGFRVDGREAIAGPGEKLHVPPGVAHDWWNAGEGEALVQVEIRPGRRFEEMAANLFGLAQDGKTNAKGMPNLLQLAVFAREFEDVLFFTKPPRVVQRALFGLLVPIARLLGYRGSYPRYLVRRNPSAQTEAWARAFEQVAGRLKQAA